MVEEERKASLEIYTAIVERLKAMPDDSDALAAAAGGIGTALSWCLQAAFPHNKEAQHKAARDFFQVVHDLIENPPAELTSKVGHA